MAVLYITEFVGVFNDHGNGGSAAFQPPAAEQTLAIGGASVPSNPFTANTKLIRLHTDAICSIEVGANPVATATTARMAAGQTEYYAVVPGHKVAVITNT